MSKKPSKRVANQNPPATIWRDPATGKFVDTSKLSAPFKPGDPDGDGYFDHKGDYIPGPNDFDGEDDYEDDDQ